MSIICLECLSEYITPEEINQYVKDCPNCNPEKYDEIQAERENGVK